MGILSLWKGNKITVKKFNNQNGDSEVALLAFNGNIRDKIIESFNKQFLMEGYYIRNGGKSSPKTILSLLAAGGGSLGLSAAASGQLFMATANPATLMTIGNGVGSAVMGAGGIVGQAPFIPVAGAIVPVVAPLIAFQVISTIAIINEFKVVNQKLDYIENTLKRIVKRNEATFIGEIISASNRLNDIENHFLVCNYFTDDMIIRLAILEDKVNSIFERFNYLYTTQYIENNMSIEDLKFKQTDAVIAINLSVLDMRVDLLRLKLAVQENPDYLNYSAAKFKDKIEFYNQLWVSIKSNSEEIKEISDQLAQTVNEMNWWQKKMPSWLLGSRKEREELEKKSQDFREESYKHQIEFKDNIENTIKLGDTIKKGLLNDNKMNLIYWQDSNGEHSYYTDELLITAK